MKLRARCVAWLLPFLVTACIHKTNTSKPQQYAPPPSTAPKPSTTAVELPPAAMTIPSQPIITAESAHLEPARKVRAKHRNILNKNAQPTANPALPAVPSTPPAPGESPEVSAIGQLSSGDPADLRRETEESLAAIERGLNGIGRELNGQEEKTAAQIREFVKQARQALGSGDVDGAHTLAAKAKVLLNELAGS